jgi:hypothetical protein
VSDGAGETAETPRSHRGGLRLPVRWRWVVIGAGVLVLVLVGTTVAVGGWRLTGGSAKRPSAAGPASEGGPTGAVDPSGSGALAGASPSGSASAPVSPSVGPSASRSTAPAARPGGKPGPGNTGVPPGTQLKVVQGNQSFDTPGQVVSGLDIHGFVTIGARNVTIRNSIIRGGTPKCNSAVISVADDYSATAVIEDSEIVASSPSPCLDGIWAFNTTMTRLNIHGVVDGVKAHDNSLVQDSWIHDLSRFASDPNQNGGATHNDGVQTYDGNRHVTLRHNTLDAGKDGNAAYQLSQDLGKVATDIHVENNWVDGGGCTLNFAHEGGPTPMTGIYVVGNRFGHNSKFDCPMLISTQTVLSQNSGNVYDDTGKPVPKPEQHD